MRSRVILAVIVALIVSASYFMRSSENPITGETQRVALSPEQEIALGLVGAVALGSGDYGTAQVVGSLINMKYGREDELESDGLGVRIMAEAGYDPRSMLRVMEVLERASSSARQPEMLSTHPNPGNRAERIQDEIARRFPSGVPDGLTR